MSRTAKPVAVVQERHVVADPNVIIGPFKLLQRTDGKWLAFDDRQPLGKMDVFVDKDRKTVEDWMARNVPA